MGDLLRKSCALRWPRRMLAADCLAPFASTNDATWRRSSFGASLIKADLLFGIDPAGTTDRQTRIQVQASAERVRLGSLA